MAWLERLDSRARRWPAVLRWLYLAVKWYLILGGAFLAFGLAYQELSERRAGLGLGLSVALILAGIKGIAGAIAQARKPTV